MNKHTLPALPYDYTALEPYIDARTMEIHHGKHHAAYVQKLNAAVEKHPEIAGLSVETLLTNLASLPEDIRAEVRNNGGGHYNHSLFWKLLGRDTRPVPEGDLAAAIVARFGSLDAFRSEFAAAAAKRFGSGWAWLSLNALGGLVVHSTPNQDSPIMEGLVPILGLDVWEHAYYLKYQNRRPDYIEAFWKVLDWRQAGENYRQALKGLDRCIPVGLRKVS
ncbi:MAG TPA: superoxide dismutase [Spirochaetota bacterium]|jgi:Fe-Mn family superoxide dismutase|nr:superoxide dismutase [Spirochaetota bacterium]HPO46399.1 superoxide dismutase [Spirochaetota bacterium]